MRFEVAVDPIRDLCDYDAAAVRHHFAQFVTDGVVDGRRALGRHDDDRSQPLTTQHPDLISRPLGRLRTLDDESAEPVVPDAAHQTRGDGR